jgi:hypothetical protein
MRPGFASAILAGLFLALSVSAADGLELKTRNASVIYEKEDLLRKFNRNIRLGSLSYAARNKMSITVEDEVRNKVDVILERVKAVLAMFPGNLNFIIILLPSDTDVQKVYIGKFGKKVDFISFYSQREKIVYISVDDVRLGVLAHELAHVVIDFYYETPTPVKVHEILAQFVESHLED